MLTVYLSLYGEAGAGRSTFINAVVGQTVAEVDHRLDSGKRSTFDHFRISGLGDNGPFLLVEVPGKDISETKSSPLLDWL